MHQYIKKYFSLFLLFLFLFPMVEKDAHAFKHQSDLHCTASDKHFHELEHTCSLCDFTITDSTYPTKTDHQFIVFTQQFLFHPFIESVFTLNAFQHIPARAPPVV